MMRYILTSLLLFSAFFIFGQTDQDLIIKLALEAQSPNEIESIIGKHQFVSKNREFLNLGLVQTNYRLKRKKKYENIGLMTLSFNSQIIYSEVYRWDLNEKWLIDEENEPPWNYQLLGKRSNNQFEALNLSLEHLVRLPNTSIFGYACYAAGGMPQAGQDMLKMIEKRDITELTSWLFSLNPVRQAFAYLGFSLLNAQKIDLESDITKKMQELKNSNVQVYTCYGCTFSDWTPFSELLSDDNVQRFIHRYYEHVNPSSNEP